MNSFERVNNAVVALARMAHRLGPKVLGAGTIRSIDELANHWQQRVWSQPWRTLLPVGQSKVLDAYVRWYTKGYLLIPPAKRGGLPRPDSLDPTIAADEVARLAEGLDAAHHYLKSKLDDAESELKSVISESADAARKAAHDVSLGLGGLGIGAIVLGGALALLYLGGRR